MAARHFEGCLPEGIQVISIEGAQSGNPTNPARYGFRDNSEPPRYALADLQAHGKVPEPLVRTLRCIGPLSQKGYDKARRQSLLVIPEVDRATASRRETSDFKHRSVEEAIGAMLTELFR